MTIEDLKIRLEKANLAVAKRMGTIEKYEKKIGKLKNQIRARGWDEANAYCKYGTEEYHEAYGMILDYEDAVRDLKDCMKKLEDQKKVVNGWEGKLSKAMETEAIIKTKVPEIFNDLLNQLTIKWTDWDIQARDRMIECRKVKSWEDFRKIYSFSDEMDLTRSDEEFSRRNQKNAENFIMDLYYRVIAKTGNITDWGSIRMSEKGLNGWVAGEKGKVWVETIEAGGYNVQRFHYRVLVK